PITGSHVSIVHTSSSLQTIGAPLQAPAEQASFSVQELPSSQGSMLSTTAQPEPKSQKSVVHGLPSLQLTSAPWHVPAAQTSISVHTSPSSHGLTLNGYWHKPPTQTWSVQGFASSTQSPLTTQPPTLPSPMMRLSIPKPPPWVNPP